MSGGPIRARLLTMKVDIERKDADESAGDGTQLREGPVDGSYMSPYPVLWLDVGMHTGVPGSEDRHDDDDREETAAPHT